MFKAKINGKTVRLTNKDYHRLLKRFDLDLFRSEPDAGYVMRNYTRCPLCEKFFSSSPICKGCPFAQFAIEEGHAGCWDLIRQFRPERVYLFVAAAFVEIKTNEETKEFISNIYEFLLNEFEKEVK